MELDGEEAEEPAAVDPVIGDPMEAKNPGAPAAPEGPSGPARAPPAEARGRRIYGKRSPETEWERRVSARVEDKNKDDELFLCEQDLEDEKHVNMQMHAFAEQVQDHIRDFGTYGIGACRDLRPPATGESEAPAR